MIAARIVIGAVASALLSATVGAQCRPPAGSHEARLLAFYEAPLAFSMAAAPGRLRAGAVRIGAELIPLPTPAPALQRPDYCYGNTTTDTRLTPVFGRPRISVALPGGIVLEGSYLPGISVGGAEASLAGLALGYVRAIPVRAFDLTLVARGHGTAGRIRGAITCPADNLQTADAATPCYGTRPSRDTFRPNALGIEAALGTASGGGRVSAYLGGGRSWLRPRFVTGFADLAGNVDRTSIAVDLTRSTVFAGATVRLRGPLALSLQGYAVPGDATTIRAACEYRLR